MLCILNSIEHFFFLRKLSFGMPFLGEPWCLGKLLSHSLYIIQLVVQHAGDHKKGQNRFQYTFIEHLLSKEHHNRSQCVWCEEMTWHLPLTRNITVTTLAVSKDRGSEVTVGLRQNGSIRYVKWKTSVGPYLFFFIILFFILFSRLMQIWRYWTFEIK